MGLVNAANTVILSGLAQTVPISFDTKVIGTTAPEAITIFEGTSSELSANLGDTIQFQKPISGYTFQREGVNGLSIVDTETEAFTDIALNGDISLIFSDGQAESKIGLIGDEVEITVQDAIIGVVPVQPSITLTSLPTFPLFRSDPANRIILNGEDQTIVTALSGSYIGTSGKETLQVKDGTELSFTGNADDRVELAVDSKDATLQQVGVNGLNVETAGGTKLDIALNAPVVFAFQDGSVVVDVGIVETSPTITISGTPVNELNADSLGSLLNADDKSSLPSEEEAEPVTDVLAPIDQAEVTVGTAVSDNIDADQGGATVSGGAGVDRFIISRPDLTQFVTIDDFSNGEQLRFVGDFIAGDVNVRNTNASDGLVEFALFRTVVTLSNLAPEIDATIFSTDSFLAALGDDALFFA